MHHTQDKYLTLRAAAEMYSLSERTIRRRVADGSVGAVRVGPRTIRVLTADVEALARPIPTVGTN